MFRKCNIFSRHNASLYYAFGVLCFAIAYYDTFAAAIDHVIRVWHHRHAKFPCALIGTWNWHVLLTACIWHMRFGHVHLWRYVVRVRPPTPRFTHSWAHMRTLTQTFGAINANAVKNARTNTNLHNSVFVYETWSVTVQCKVSSTWLFNNDWRTVF